MCDNNTHEPISVESFSNEDLEQVIASIDNFHGYSSYWQRFRNESDKAAKAGNATKARQYEVMSAVSSYMIEPDSTHSPFKPVAVFGNKRTPLPEDLSPNELEFLRGVFPRISNALLKARIGDVLWLLGKPREKDYALAAIDAYMTFGLGDEKLLGDAKNGWLRAVLLCKLLRTAAESRYADLKSRLLDRIKELPYEQKWDLLDTVEIALECSFQKEEYQLIAECMKAILAHAKSASDWMCVQRFSDSMVTLYARTKDEHSIAETHRDHAESYASMAEIRANANMLRGSWLEMAIKIYRQIPRKFREEFSVDDRLAQLHKEMNTANEHAIDEMHAIETPPIDISKMVEAARNHVKGKQFPDVVFYLAHVSGLRNREESQKGAEDLLKGHVVTSLFGSTHISTDGRVASRTPGIDLGNAEAESTKAAIWRQMMNDYSIGIGLSVSGSILPALDMVNLEHHISERRLLPLCGASQTVPSGREHLWAKGLYYGFEGDFAAAIHILSPQVENLVRLILKNAGIKTTTLDSEGIETENGLSALLDKPEAPEALGDDFHYELEALLAGAAGHNLRNHLSHGLMSYGECYSQAAVYFWWYCLRLAIGGVKLKEQAEDASSESSAQEETAA